MGFWENFKNIVSLSPDDDDFDNEFDVENTVSEPVAAPVKEVAETRRSEREPRSFRGDKKVVSYNENAGSTQMQVVLVRPERFEDVPGIADHLNSRKTVVLNLEAADRDVSRRIIDFLSGVAYANRGSIKKVANSTFIIVPTTVDVSGELMLDDIENSARLYY